MGRERATRDAPGYALPVGPEIHAPGYAPERRRVGPVRGHLNGRPWSSSKGFGLGPTQSLSEGDIHDLGRRRSFSRDMRDRLIRVEAEESLPVTALAAGADEIAAELATRILMRFRAR